VDEVTRLRTKSRDLERDARRAYTEAGRYWKQSNAYGGEVAFHYAERARELHSDARRAALDAARAMVQDKRFQSGQPDSVDLHGLTSQEAKSIV